MNTRLKRFVIIISIIILAGIAGYVIVSEKIKSELSKMYTPDTKRLNSQIYMIKDSFVEMYLIRDSNNYIAIDAGANVPTIRKELKSLWIDSTKVSAILLTHSDGDHVAALSMFPNAKIYLSADEEQMINGKTAKMFFFHNSISSKDYTLLKDEQQLNIGKIGIKAIATPGHTPGSMSYLINDTLLFVGDAFGLKNGRIIKPNSLFTSDMKTAVSSFQKINKLSTAKYLFTAHTGFTIDYKFAVDTTMTE